MTSKTSTSYRFSQQTINHIESLRIARGLKSGREVIETLVFDAMALQGTRLPLDKAQVIEGIPINQTSIARDKVKALYESALITDGKSTALATNESPDPVIDTSDEYRQ